jgi:hypothetical protein
MPKKMVRNSASAIRDAIAIVLIGVNVASTWQHAMSERRGAGAARSTARRIEAPAAQLYTSTGSPAGQPERAWALSRHVHRVHGRYKYRLYISYLKIDGCAPIISGVAVAWATMHGLGLHAAAHPHTYPTQGEARHAARRTSRHPPYARKGSRVACRLVATCSVASPEVF